MSSTDYSYSKSFFDFDASSSVSYGAEYGRPTSKKVRNEYKSKFANTIFNDLLCELGFRSSSPQIALFVDGHSILTEEDKHIVSKIYITHISGLSVHEVGLHSYDIGIIDNILDHVKSTMQRGNIIKEALQCLQLSKDGYLVISSKEIDKEELESLALFAGAKKIIEPECLKNLEHTCIVVTN